MSNWFESSDSEPRFYVWRESDTHKTVVYKGKWKRPRGKEPYLKWVRIEATPLKEAHA